MCGRWWGAVAIGEAALGSRLHLTLYRPSQGSGGRGRMAGSPRWGSTGLWLGRGVRMGVVYRMWLWLRDRMRVMWLWWRWQWVVGQGVWMWVTTLHGTLLIGRWFMVGLIVLIVLVVEAAIPLHGTTYSTCVSPTRSGMMTLAGCAMVGHAGRWSTLNLGRLRGKATRGWNWGSTLGSPRWRGHGLTDYRGVSNMGPGCCRGLRQLSTASAWCTGPRGGGDRTSADRTTALHKKWNKANKKNEPRIQRQNM